MSVIFFTLGSVSISTIAGLSKFSNDHNSPSCLPPILKYAEFPVTISIKKVAFWLEEPGGYASRVIIRGFSNVVNSKIFMAASPNYFIFHLHHSNLLIFDLILSEGSISLVENSEQVLVLNR